MEKFRPLFFQILCCHYFILAFWGSNHVSLTRLLMLCPLIFPYFFPFCLSLWKVNIFMSSNSLIFSSLMSNLLLTPFHVFFFLFRYSILHLYMYNFLYNSHLFPHHDRSRFKGIKLPAQGHTTSLTVEEE